MTRPKDVTFQFLHSTDYEVHEERKSNNIWSQELKEIVEQREENARIILRNEPKRTVHDVAIITFLPVLTVRELKKEIDDRNEWLNRNYLDEIKRGEFE